MKISFLISCVFGFQILHSIDGTSFTARGNILVEEKKAVKVVNPVEAQGLISAEAEKYYIKLVGNGLEMTKSIPLCLLLTSRFQDQIVVHFDENDKPFHFDYMVNADICKNVGFRKEKYRFRTQIALEKSRNGPVPVLRKAEIVAEQKPNQSFLMKYWYIFVPLTLMLLLSGGEEKK